MTLYTEILKAHRLVVQKKMKAEDYDALIFGTVAGYRKTPNYYEYIQSNVWKAKADAAKKRAGYRCQLCNKGREDGAVLDAHHRTYERLGSERPEDITVLCHECHELYETNKRAF